MSCLINEHLIKASGASSKTLSITYILALFRGLAVCRLAFRLKTLLATRIVLVRSMLVTSAVAASGRVQSFDFLSILLDLLHGAYQVTCERQTLAESFVWAQVCAEWGGPIGLFIDVNSIMLSLQLSTLRLTFICTGAAIVSHFPQAFHFLSVSV